MENKKLYATYENTYKNLKFHKNINFYLLICKTNIALVGKKLKTLICSPTQFVVHSLGILAS